MAPAPRTEGLRPGGRKGHVESAGAHPAGSGHGIQAEVLLSLGLVMVLATLVLTVVLVFHHQGALRDLVGRALIAEARVPRPVGDAFVPGTVWWTVSPEEGVVPRGPVVGVIDPESRALASQAREVGEPLLRPGGVHERIRVAVPIDASGRVAVGALPVGASAALRFSALPVVGAVVVADVLIFTGLGLYLLRRRLIVPLQRLAAAAGEIAEGADGTRVPVEGTREAAAVASAFNEMSDALERRKDALEKAVVELRDANADLRQARAGLDRAERLAAVGQLASGVAHEVGNPIGAILAFVDLAARDPRLGEESREYLARAGREGVRVRTILRQLLDFSRPARATPQAVDLGAAGAEAVSLVSAQQRYQDVAFEVQREKDAPQAWADPAAVSQILVNLLINAADAVRGQEEARVVLSVRPGAIDVRRGEDADAARARRRPEAVECVVSDNGPGIPESHAERIFDPFFTTKPPGEGTGLGLANSARLAEEQEGRLERIAPAAGLATAFALRLPSAEAATHSPAQARRELRGTHEAA